MSSGLPIDSGSAFSVWLLPLPVFTSDHWVPTFTLTYQVLCTPVSAAGSGAATVIAVPPLMVKPVESTTRGSGPDVAFPDSKNPTAVTAERPVPEIVRLVVVELRGTFTGLLAGEVVREVREAALLSVGCESKTALRDVRCSVRRSSVGHNHNR